VYASVHENDFYNFIYENKLRFDELKMEIDMPEIRMNRLEAMFNPLIQDEIQRLPENAKTKYGDLYDLGRHRLLCGDSTDFSMMERLLLSIRGYPDMIFTDPPFDMDNDIVSAVFDNAWEIAEVQFWLLSDKQCISLCSSKSSFIRLYVHDFVQATMIASNQVMQRHNCIAQFGSRASRNLFDGFSTIISVPTLRTTKEHLVFPYGKRIELPAIFLRHFCNGACLDVFGGSGSTLLAAEQLGFSAYLMELNPAYCDLIINRWETLTNNRAVKLN